MREILLLSLLSLPLQASALSVSMTGAQVDLAGAVGFHSTPPAAALGGAFGASFWFGRYDESYALGRWNSIGPVVRLESAGGALRTSPLLEFRRGYDLFAIKPWFSISAGAELSDGVSTGLQVRAGGGAKYRVNRFMGISARLDGGIVLIDGDVAARTGLLLGIDWSAPFNRLKHP